MDIICIYVDFLKPSFTAITGHHIEYFFDWTIYTSRNQHNRQILESLKWWTWRTGHARSIGVFERFLCCQVHSNPAQLVKLLHSSIFRGKCPEDTIHISTSIGWILSCLHLNYDDRQFKDLLFLFEQKKARLQRPKNRPIDFGVQNINSGHAREATQKTIRNLFMARATKKQICRDSCAAQWCWEWKLHRNRETRGLTPVEFIGVPF